MKIPNNYKILLFLIIVLALLLRLVWFDQVPPSLYSDEVSQGYNAFSLLKSGADEYGKSWPVAFRSFGDWKPPLPTYLIMPAVYLLGLNVWGVRLPGTILSVFAVILVFLLVRDGLILYEEKTKKLFQRNFIVKIALLSTLFLTISPWHIFQSRVAMLVNVTFFFLILGLWSFVKSIKNPLYLILCSISMALSIYSYYGMRLIVPLLIIFMFIIYPKKHQQIKYFWLSLISGLVLLLPLGLAFFKEPDVIFGRARTVSIFYDQGVRLRVWDWISADGSQLPNWLIRFFHNKPHTYLWAILNNFFVHLDGRFLFLNGDQQFPFQLPGTGVLYLLDAVFILCGIYYLIRNHRKILNWLIYLVGIFIIPAALTFVTPASNRAFNLVLINSFVTAIGAIRLYQIAPQKFKNILLLLISLGYAVSTSQFINIYFIKLPKLYADRWHYGYKQLFAKTEPLSNKYDQLVIAGPTTVSYIFLLFYLQESPQYISSNIDRNLTADIYGFESVDRYGNYYFPRDFNWSVDKNSYNEHTLYALTEKVVLDEDAKIIDHIYYPNGQVVFNLVEKINSK